MYEILATDELGGGSLIIVFACSANHKVDFHALQKT